MIQLLVKDVQIILLYQPIQSFEPYIIFQIYLVLFLIKNSVLKITNIEKFNYICNKKNIKLSLMM